MNEMTSTEKRNQTFNDEDLGFLMSLLLGDGHLTEHGRIVIAHGAKQQDYCEWKANKISQIVKTNVKALPTRTCYQLQVSRKQLGTYKFKIYPNGKKSLPRILDYIKNPLEAIALWVCDDGNICPSITSNKKCYSSSLQIFTFTELEESTQIANWFELHTGIRPNLLFRDRSKTGRKSAYILRFKAEDSRQLYKKIKSYIPNLPSMIYKFRYIEHNISKSPQVID